jgi:hypothetical protein
MDAHTEARTGVVPQVVFHGYTPEGAQENDYGRSNIDGPTTVTQYVQSVTWTHAVQPPYETIQLELKFPGSVFQALMPGVRLRTKTRAPSTGFWVVLYLPNDRDGEETWSAIHWGYCTQLQVRAVSDPGLGTQMVSVSVQCESWVGLLQRNTIFLTAGKNYVREGAAYTLRSWADEMNALLQSAIGDPPGVPFAKVFHMMGTQLLPNSLASGMGEYMTWPNGSANIPYSSGPLGGSESTSQVVGSKCYKISDVIRLVHDRETCAKHAPLRVLQHKAVTGLGVTNVGQAIPRGSTWSFLQSSFFSSPYIECFPTLEWPVLSSEIGPLSRRLGPGQSGNASDSTEAASAYFDESLSYGTDHSYYELPLEIALANEDIATDWVITMPAPFNGDLNDPSFPLGEAFGGANPCLIYRMRPTLFTSINQTEATIRLREDTAGEKDENWYRTVTGTSASERLGINQTTHKCSPDPNMHPNPWYNWLASEVHETTWSYSEESRVNMVFAKTPYRVQSQLADLNNGIPVVCNPDVSKHGLRMRIIDWPFYPPRGIEQAEGTLEDHLTALNEELWMMTASNGHGHFFGSGTVRGIYKPWVKAGHYVAVQWRREPGAAGETSWTPFVGEDESAPGFRGYITSVTHRVGAAGNGAITASTTMQLERISVMEGTERSPLNYPPSDIVDIVLDRPLIIDPDTGQKITGTVTTNEDGTITFTPDPTAGG